MSRLIAAFLCYELVNPLRPMATGILRFSPDLINTWLLKQLRRVPLPLTRGNLKTPVVEESLPVQVVLSADQEIIILAKTARELEAGYQDVINSLNNIHVRNLEGAGSGFAEEIGNLALALEVADYESMRSSAGRLFHVLGDLQSNIPAWDYIRGIQQLVARCRSLKKAA